MFRFHEHAFMQLSQAWLKDQRIEAKVKKPLHGNDAQGWTDTGRTLRGWAAFAMAIGQNNSSWVREKAVNSPVTIRMEQ